MDSLGRKVLPVGAWRVLWSRTSDAVGLKGKAAASTALGEHPGPAPASKAALPAGTVPAAAVAARSQWSASSSRRICRSREARREFTSVRRELLSPCQGQGDVVWTEDHMSSAVGCVPESVAATNTQAARGVSHRASDSLEGPEAVSPAKVATRWRSATRAVCALSRAASRSMQRSSEPCARWGSGGVGREACVGVARERRHL